MAKEYLVQPKQYGARKADYKTGKSINEKWRAISSEDAFDKSPNGFCGNIGMYTLVNSKTKKVKIYKNISNSTKKNVSLSEAISAALALYRTICMINNPIIEADGAQGYKVPWTISLIHQETGKILNLTEWKGAFNIHTEAHSVEQLPASFKRDIIQLLNLMLSDTSPHPYDNCTAGIVA